MILSKAQYRLLDETGNIFPTSKPNMVSPADVLEESIKFKATGIYPTPYNLWAMVRYVLHPNLGSTKRYIIAEAIAHWEANTNVRFYNATGEPTVHPTYGFAYPYVEFFDSAYETDSRFINVNDSFVGRIGGMQRLRLGPGAWISTAIHEIGHAIGLHHEQTRNDRDSYLIVNRSNVTDDDYNRNFAKIPTDYFNVGAFDFGSIMVYGSFDFAINPSTPVLTRLDGTTFDQNTVLSSLDRQWANTLYLPYVARTDAYRQLASVVYKPDNTLMTECERVNLQAALNNQQAPCIPPKNPPVE